MDGQKINGLNKPFDNSMTPFLGDSMKADFSGQLDDSNARKDFEALLDEKNGKNSQSGHVPSILNASLEHLNQNAHLSFTSALQAKMQYNPQNIKKDKGDLNV